MIANGRLFFNNHMAANTALIQHFNNSYLDEKVLSI